MYRFFQIIIVVVVVVVLPFGVKAQTVYQPQNAKATIQVLKDKVKVGKNGKGTVKFTIIPNKDWYVYSIKEVNGMPINVESSIEDLFTIGKLTETPKPTKEFHEVFEADIFKHFSSVTITAPIHFNKKAKLKSIKNFELIVQFQTASDVSGSCITDEQRINLQVDSN